jgi:Cu(I)-responsive transcriptional regulator
MKIGEAATSAELPVKTVRYYAEIDLVTPNGRTEGGYREYDQTAVRKLKFVARSRSFGFSIPACRELLSLYEDRSRASADVKRIAQERLADLDAKLSEMKLLRDELAHLSENCAGNARPDCPIIDGLAGDAAP